MKSTSKQGLRVSQHDHRAGFRRSMLTSLNVHHIRRFGCFQSGSCDLSDQF